MLDSTQILEMMPPLVKEPPAQPLTKEQIELQNLAKRIKDIGNQIIKDNNLETQPDGENLAWILNSTDSSRGEPSFSALQLKAAIEHGIAEGGIKISFKNLKIEPGLKTKFGPDVEHGLTRTFLEGLGATLPTNREDWEKTYDREHTNTIRISNPKKPFEAECRVDGPTSTGEPNLIGFTLRQKAITLPAAV